MYLIICLLALVVILMINNYRKESFYQYIPPSNCMETTFGNIRCYPPFMTPFYNSEYYYPFYFF